jgi:hypothetical protein
MSQDRWRNLSIGGSGKHITGSALGDQNADAVTISWDSTKVANVDLAVLMSAIRLQLLSAGFK